MAKVNYVYIKEKKHFSSYRFFRMERILEIRKEKIWSFGQSVPFTKKSAKCKRFGFF